VSRLTQEVRDELRELADPGWISDAEMIALLDDSDEVDQLREQVRETAATNRWFDLMTAMVEMVDAELEKRGLGIDIMWGVSNGKPSATCEISERLEDPHG
jgi:hypothetical protein